MTSQTANNELIRLISDDRQSHWNSMFVNGIKLRGHDMIKRVVRKKERKKVRKNNWDEIEKRGINACKTVI